MPGPHTIDYQRRYADGQAACHNGPSNGASGQSGSISSANVSSCIVQEANLTSNAGKSDNFQQESTRISQSDEDPPLRPHNSEVISQPKSQIYENKSHLATSSLIQNNTADDMISTNHDMNYRNQLSTPNLFLNFSGVVLKLESIG